MTWRFKFLYRITIVIMLLFCLVFGLARNAMAQGIDVGSEVAAGETVENDLVLFGNTINLDGTVAGDVLAVGSTIQVNGTVEGSLIALGGFPIINGQVAGTTYVVGQELTLQEAASLGRNLYFLGLTLNTLEGSQIGRDLVALSLGANLEGEIGRQVRAIIGPVPIIQIIMQLIGKEVGGLSANVPGAMIIEASSQTDYASVLPLEQFLSAIDPQSGGIDAQQLGEWALERLRELITLFVFGMLGIWLLPRQLTRTVEIFQAKWLRSLGIGLLSIVIAFNIIGVVILLAAIIIAIGYGLGTITLWGLAGAVWAVGLTGLALAFTLFWLFVIYGTKVIVAYVGGRLLLDRLAPKANKYKVVPLLLGLVLYVILHGIPILGWVVAILATAVGLGISWLVWRNKETSPIEDPIS